VTGLLPAAPAANAIAPALIAWAETHGRHGLPWQQDSTPYRVWVSEVMLQQTQVATVVPYYQRFTGRFPDIPSLASAPLDAVLSLWAGLGYYARARNLHRAAQLAVERHGGCLPDDIAALQRLPGIGRSTAAAILALSSSQRHPILDGNARRVLTRLFAVDGNPDDRATRRCLWALAEACTPCEGVAAYTQAIMDLGSGVCVRANPRCDDCPLSGLCLAHRSGRQHALPPARRRAQRPHRSACAVVATRGNGSLLLERQPSPGVWGGLWSFPTFESESEALQRFDSQLAGEPQRLPPQRHAFTHFDLTLRPVIVQVAATAALSPGQRWFSPRQLSSVGLSKAVTRFLDYKIEWRVGEDAGVQTADG
jgi:A/G-specific adenine glycosylase